MYTKGEVQAGNRYLGLLVFAYQLATDEGVKRRAYILLPTSHVSNPFCQVEIYAEEVDELQHYFKGRWEDVAVPDLTQTNVIGKSLLEDLYYVWDDGAGAHPERARRLYDAFKLDIEKHRPAARRMMNEAIENMLKKARLRKLDVKLMTSNVSMDEYGKLPELR